MLLAIIRVLRALREYRRNLDELAHLTDRELADIGINRSEIYAVAAGTFRR